MVSLNGEDEILALTGTSLTVNSFGGKELRNYSQFTVKVRSVNGSWTSPWSGEKTVTPVPSGRPDKPDNVKAVGGYKSVTVSWKDMKDTVSYKVFFKEESAEEFTLAAEEITGTSYTISDLNCEEPTTYVVYVVGCNELGDSEPSMQASATTSSLEPPQMPQYNLLNRDDAGNPGTSHITSATNVGTMVDSPLDEEKGTGWGTVDGNPASYYERNTWDDGGYNNLGNLGLIYEFDQAYKMDTIAMMSAETNMDFTYAHIRCWDENGDLHDFDKSLMRSERRNDANGKSYFVLTMPEPVEVQKIQIGVARAWAPNNRVSVSEVYFYKFDPLKGELMDLYTDDLHITIRDDVTEDQLNSLKDRIENSVDEFGHENPNKAQLLREWDTAWKIFQDQKLNSRITTIHNGITTGEADRGFSGLNAWQPLGVTAAAGETVTVYVSHDLKRSGENTNLQLVVTQYNAESSAMFIELNQTLKVGANEIQIPKVWTTTGVESGGALYIQCTGGNSGQFAVRVSGGTQVPVLDLYQVSDDAQRLALTEAYMAELNEYVGKISELHSQVHENEDPVTHQLNKEVNYPYDEKTCILGATDIMLDTMMLSLPAQQIVAGAKGSAQTLLASLDAMEDMMHLFYQHKGLNANAKDAVDRIPVRHLNIRYMRMFSGAFMYASGNHIGIQWNEAAGMASCGGVQSSNGAYTGGNFFGWGIAHEIGHDINQGIYAIAEITNNYFAVLAQAKDTNDSVRFLYENVYDKVTSGTKGSASNVFTQLGMYWQLHLAYDKGYNYATYDKYQDQLDNLFWARVDTYARTPSKAPGSLNLEGLDREQALMRLACAAAQKDLLDFFQRWGKTPDQGTIDYASQFEKETRAIYYVCDDSRRYTLEHSGSGKLGTGGSVAAIASVSAEVDPDQANLVHITVKPNGTVPAGEILGYEILRCTYAGGEVEKHTVGFSTDGSFDDLISAMNNRTVTYEVTLVDQYLNRSAAAASSTVKIQHQGDLAKNSWTVSVAGLKADTSDAKQEDATDELPCETNTEDVALRMTDSKTATVYKALVEEEGASILVDFHEDQVVTGFRYTAGTGTPIAGYTLELRRNDAWTKAAEGTLGGNQTVYFANSEGSYVSTYEADAMRLTLTGQTGQTVSVAELDALGVTGDNVDFRTADGTPAVGTLTAAYQYGQNAADVIPEGSLVFTGSYKGNAAYNVVLLFDEHGYNVGGLTADGALKAHQIILADKPKAGVIQDVTDGVWIYWIEPADQAGMTMPKQVRAELYRVNDAQTNEGQRLVSDSLFIQVPETLGGITLSKN